MRKVSLAVPEGFRSLAATLLASFTAVSDEPSIDIVQEEQTAHQLLQGECEEERARAEFELLRELRLFRARIIEGVEAAVETLVADIAAQVLGRELQLKPAEIETIINRTLQRYLADEPLRVRVHPSETASASCGVPVVGDERLRTGDAVIELRSGYVQATLGVRLASLLQAPRA